MRGNAIHPDSERFREKRIDGDALRRARQKVVVPRFAARAIER